MSDKTEAIDQERQSVSTPEHTARNAEVSRTVAGFGRSALDRHLRNESVPIVVEGFGAAA